MSNWDFVFPYDQEVADWLEEQHCPHPAVQAGNRLPTTSEVKLAAAESGVNAKSPIVIDNFDWNKDDTTPQDSFKVKGDRTLAFTVLVVLSRICGQLCFFPDTGEPSIVVEPWMNGRALSELHVEASNRDESGLWMYQKLFGSK